MTDAERFLSEHAALSRRFFLRGGLAGALAGASSSRAAEPPPALAESLAKIEPYFTAQDEFQDVSRGAPKPHTLAAAKRKEVGLTRDTWKLEVVADPENPATLGRPLTVKDGTALDFAALLKLGEARAVRFAKVMTCLNIGCPLGMGVWEGVPLRDVLWMTQPKENLRRVFYYGYHNDDPKQLFRSSLPVGRVLEDYDGLPPVILCYKLNGDWLTPERGGPVRVVVPEAYGFKSIKWLSHVVLSNLFYANDTYGNAKNDVDSPLKTFAATLQVKRLLKANEALPVTGYAQVGVSGLSKVQVWVAAGREGLAGGRPVLHRRAVGRRRDPPAPQGVGRRRGRRGADGRPRLRREDGPAEGLADAAGEGPLGGAAAGPARGRVRAALPGDGREGPGPADAAAVQEVRPLRHRDGEAER